MTPGPVTGARLHK
uniref:Uncharacterized protein n=1 Tax=Anguilla anguilla TaxID=7936 RepID=A0A0E9TNV6_ANGAN